MRSKIFSRQLRYSFLLISLLAAMGFVVGPAVADQNEGTTPTLQAAAGLITVGGLHACALESGAVQCWGDNQFGQLGDGTNQTSSIPRTVVGITNAMAVSAGNDETCALLADTTVKCWGDNRSGGLGNGTTTASNTPVAVTGITGAAAIAVGGFHACALISGGSVKCWGLDGTGQLGDGGRNHSSVPVQVSGLTNATAITAGDFQTCALLADHSVRCWGHNGFGQLGDGTMMDRGTPVAVQDIDGTTPATSATAVSTGSGHTCAAMADGNVKCWGDDTFNQLGDDATPVPPATTPPPQPTPVTVHGINALANPAVAITTGQEHSCALLNDGTAACWGNNESGQVGDSTTTNRKTATPVFGLTSVTALTAGGFDTCALSSGSLVCWGYNFYGQLAQYVAQRSTNAVAGTISKASSVSAGNGQTCAIVRNQQPVCWGRNDAGQLGNAMTGADSTMPSPVSGITAATQVVTGNLFTCALPQGSGIPMCWGANDTGQLGNGSTSPSTVPVTVTGVTDATAVTAGGTTDSSNIERGHACALLTDGTVWCWGRNANGQLGDGTNIDASAPVEVEGLSNATAVSAGGLYTCAIRSDQTVACWGADGSGQLGDGSNTDSNTPVAVQTLTGVTSLAAGAYHTCAVSSGNIYCWGQDDRGQLGDGGGSNQNTPEMIALPAGSAPAKTVVAGDFYTCALLTDSNVLCWGDNDSGQLGDGSTTERDSPTPIDSRLQAPSGFQLIQAISAGRDHTCVVLIDQSVRCWGDNNHDGLTDGVGSTVTFPQAALNLAAPIGP
jgi:alpha-tubulin suppressor-like RCC1 family protein